MPGERYGVDDAEVDIERVRLGMLAEARDPKSFEMLERVGIAEGMHCLELGAGAGTVSAWMAEQVGADGRVMSTDIDLQFHNDMPDNVIVRQHDIENDKPLPAEHFDIVHARAVMQHVPTREAVMGKLIDCLKPGGWLVIEDGNMMEFAAQTLPEPYGPIHQTIAGATHEEWREPNCGLLVAGWMRDRGLTDIDIAGDVWAMRPGEPSGEWWFLALERAIPTMVEFGLVDGAAGERALEQVREPGFVMMSPTSIATGEHATSAASVSSSISSVMTGVDRSPCSERLEWGKVHCCFR